MYIRMQSEMHPLIIHPIGQGPMPDAVACALGTSVAAMNQLQVLRMYDLPLPILKALAERKDPLEKLYIFQPGVNWVSVATHFVIFH